MTKSEKEPTKKNKPAPGSPSERLEELLKVMDEAGLDELEISDGEAEVKLVRQSAVPAAPAARPAAPGGRAPQPSEPEGKNIPVKSPLAGVFYRSPSPQAAPFVKEGDVVSPEKVLCIIEAMKVLNEITAGVSGRIASIPVENGKPVQNGQTLFLVEPAS